MQALKATALITALMAVMLLPTGGHALELPTGIIRQDGHSAPPLMLEDMDGNRLALRSLRGKWVFVHFWASWCGPCRRELPRLQALPGTLDPQRFAMVLVNTSEDEDTVFSFLSAVAPELTTLLDRDGLATEAWRPRGLPATYLVDPEGRVLYQALGGRAWDEPPYLNFLKALIAGR